MSHNVSMGIRPDEVTQAITISILNVMNAER
jgi:hypothetical protein